jgi:tetratricopeptide (TPR) repeat protein
MKIINIIILVFFSYSSWSQDLKQTFDFANELYEKKDYSGAGETFRRVIYFDTKEQYRSQCYKKIADCLYETKEYAEAADYYELAYFQQADDSSKTEILFRKITCFLVLNNFEYAQIELLNISDSIDSIQKKRKIFYSAVIHFANENFEESKTSFQKLIDSSHIEQKNRINELFKQNEKVSKLSPKKARILSMIMPGLGQLYAGDVKNGLNSFLLTTGIVAWGVAAAIQSASPVDALISALPWFQRYYTGGYTKAEAIAENQKKKRRSKIYNQILDTIQTN